MSNKRKHIDELFRDKLGKYSETPPADAWYDMDKMLDTLKPLPVKVNPFRWLGHVAIVSVIGLLSVPLVKKFIGTESIVVENSDNYLAVNNSDVVTSSDNLNNTGNNVQSAFQNTDDEQEDNNEPVSKGAVLAQAVIYDEPLAENEQYAANADEEYVEGVTPIEPDVVSVIAITASNAHYGAASDVESNTQDNLTVAENPQQTVYNSAHKSIENQIVAKVVQNAKPSLLSANEKSEDRNVNTSQPKWEWGVKAGYQRGFDNSASSGVAIAPYVAYKVSNRWSLMVQPGVIFATAPLRNIGESKSYYKVNDDAQVTLLEKYTSTSVEGTSVIVYNNEKYRYTQSHDSIVKSNRTGGQYMQYELPVMGKYKISDKVSVYGGVNFVYSRLQTVTEHTYIKSGILKTVDTVISSTAAPVAPATGDVITYSGTPVSDYQGAQYPSAPGNMLRIGGVAGFTYTCSDRWLFDAMVQKSSVTPSVKGGYDVNAPLSAPSFRVSVGYRLNK